MKKICSHKLHHTLSIDNRGQLLKIKNCSLKCCNDYLITYVGNYFHGRQTGYCFSDKIHRTIKNIVNIQERISYHHNLLEMITDKGNTVVIMYRDVYVETNEGYFKRRFFCWGFCFFVVLFRFFFSFFFI